MIFVAAAFAFSDIVMMKYIAFGLIFALAIDATVIRLLLVPAVMHLLREDNWWAPAWVKKIYHAIGGHGGEDDPVTERVEAPVHREREPAAVGAGAVSTAAQVEPEAAAETDVVEHAAPPLPSNDVTAEQPAVPDPVVPEEGEDEDLSVEDVTVAEDSHAARSGVSADQDTELIPFAELMRRLQEERHRGGPGRR